MNTAPPTSGLIILDSEAFTSIYGSRLAGEIAARVRLAADPLDASAIRDRPDLLAGAEVIFSGWGAPVLDEEFLRRAPRLRAFFYGAGSVRPFVTDAFWSRGIALTCAKSINAIPVAEFALGAVLLSLKRTWHHAAEVRRLGTYPSRLDAPGGFRSRVGLISFGSIARRLRSLLEPFELDVSVHDPFLTPDQALAAKVTACPLEEIFRTCDIVSLHAPMIAATRGMITGALIRSMKPGATFINTARGTLVDEDALISALRDRPDLTALLDVARREPPDAGSPLYHLPNVVLTPHLAGSLGRECERMGQFMIDEFDRWIRGERLHGTVTREAAALEA